MHEWHLYKKYGGGMIYDWGVHLIDQILFMMPDAKIKPFMQTSKMYCMRKLMTTLRSF